MTSDFSALLTTRKLAAWRANAARMSAIDKIAGIAVRFIRRIGLRTNVLRKARHRPLDMDEDYESNQVCNRAVKILEESRDNHRTAADYLAGKC
jgi:hypothetical protein